MKREKVIPEGKKTWSNYYWYYYKSHIIFGLIILIGIIVCSTQCALKKNPDYYIVFYSDSYVNSSVVDKMADESEKYADDRNGDGEVYIQAINCSYSPNDQSLKLTANQQANQQITSDSAIIWILDDAGVNQYYSKNDLNIFGENEALDAYESHALHIDDTELGSVAKTAGYNEDYYIFFRYKKENIEYNKTAENIILNLKNQ